MRPLVLLALWLLAGAASASTAAGRHLEMDASPSVLAQAVDTSAPPVSRSLRKGKVHVELWVSDIQPANLAVKIGGGPFYLTLLSGLGSDDEGTRFSLGLGVGGHLSLSRRFWLDMDVTGGGVQPVQKALEGDGGNVLGQARVMLGFQLLPRLAVFAGPTYNLWYVWGRPDFTDVTTLPVNESQSRQDRRLQHWPGLQVGLHI